MAHDTACGRLAIVASAGRTLNGGNGIRGMADQFNFHGVQAPFSVLLLHYKTFVAFCQEALLLSAYCHIHGLIVQHDLHIRLVRSRVSINRLALFTSHLYDHLISLIIAQKSNNDNA
jgi:hypothetical protein